MACELTAYCMRGSDIRSQRASDQRSKFKHWNIISYLLQAVMGTASGSREMLVHSEISRSRNIGKAEDVKSNIPVEERWQSFIEEEGARRLGWCIYVSKVSELLTTELRG
jgi:hypothetical protein